MPGVAYLLAAIILIGSLGRGEAVPLPPPRPTLPGVASLPKQPTIPSRSAIPLPPSRPASEPAPRRNGEFVAAPVPAQGPCPALLALGIAVAESGEIRNGNPECGGPALVRLSAVLSPEGKPVQLKPAAVLSCETALAVARWIREDLAPAARTLGSPLAQIEVAASYVCRSRNNVPGAPISEHARANALDIRAFGLFDGRTYPIAGPVAVPEFIALVRRTACARFTTVLGPGSDAAHELHLHVDLAQRRGGYRMCQWSEPRTAGR